VARQIEDDFGLSRFLWQAVLAEMHTRYPGQQKPLYWSSLLPRPVNGTLGHIGVFDGGDFFHFVTEGFSEILPPNPEDEHRRYELEVRLVKTPEVDEEELCQMCAFLRFLAGLALQHRDLAAFRPFALYGCGRPIDRAERSRISGLVLARNTMALPEQDSPKGKVTFLTLVGLSGDELEAIFHERVKLSFLLEKTGLRTDFGRSDWVWTVGDALTLAILLAYREPVTLVEILYAARSQLPDFHSRDLNRALSRLAACGFFELQADKRLVASARARRLRLKDFAAAALPQQVAQLQEKLQKIRLPQAESALWFDALEFQSAEHTLAALHSHGVFFTA
jgi:hypothetical protein